MLDPQQEETPWVVVEVSGRTVTSTPWLELAPATACTICPSPWKLFGLKTDPSTLNPLPSVSASTWVNEVSLEAQAHPSRVVKVEYFIVCFMNCIISKRFYTSIIRDKEIAFYKEL